MSIRIDPPEGEIQFHASIDRETLGRISIRLPADGSLSALDVVALYGPPCGVTIYGQLRKFILRYPTVSLTTQQNQNGLRLNTPITYVEFKDPAHQRQFGIQPCTEQPTFGSANRPWKGFGSVQRYLASQ
jgi:hypothetical protein